jgi:hypothetical protein
MTAWEVVWMLLFVGFVCAAFYFQERRIAVLERKLRMAIDSLLLLDDGYSLKTGKYRGYVGGRERIAEVNDGEDDAGDDGEGHADGGVRAYDSVLPGLE